MNDYLSINRENEIQYTNDEILALIDLIKAIIFDSNYHDFCVKYCRQSVLEKQQQVTVEHSSV